MGVEQLHADVLARQVVARRQAGLVELERAVGLREHLTVVLDADVPLARRWC